IKLSLVAPSLEWPVRRALPRFSSISPGRGASCPGESLAREDSTHERSLETVSVDSDRLQRRGHRGRSGMWRRLRPGEGIPGFGYREVQGRTGPHGDDRLRADQSGSAPGASRLRIHRERLLYLDDRERGRWRIARRI